MKHRWFRDKVWFTYKARIAAQERLEWLNFHSQILLVWYALLSTVMSVVTLRYKEILGTNTDLFATILSMALLIVSLTVINRNFGCRSMQMRSNYLQLQGLYNELSNNECEVTTEQKTQYANLLAQCENHKTIDDKLARFSNGNLETRKLTCSEQFEIRIWKLRRWLILILFYVMPLILLIPFLNN